jgi:hypothetical protein
MTPRLLLIVCLLVSQLLPAQQSTNDGVLARAKLATNTIEIGDQIWLQVNISAPPGTTVTGLQEGFFNTIDGIEALEEKNLNTVAETPELLLEQRFLITSFDTGYIAINPLPYVFRAADGQLDTSYTNDLLLHVNAIPVGDDNDLRPIKPIIEEPLNLLDFWPLFLLVALGSIGYAVYLNRKRRQRQAPPPPPPPPADVIALRELDALEGKSLWQQDLTKEYYSELTRILREYLEGRFDVQAMEMTTRQITSNLKGRTDFGQNQSKELSQLLQLSDLVKFAKARPAVELHAEGLKRVRTFVEETGKVPEPEEEVPAPEPTGLGLDISEEGIALIKVDAAGKPLDEEATLPPSPAPVAPHAPATAPDESSSQIVKQSDSPAVPPSDSQPAEDLTRNEEEE